MWQAWLCSPDTKFDLVAPSLLTKLATNPFCKMAPSKIVAWEYGSCTYTNETCVVALAVSAPTNTTSLVVMASMGQTAAVARPLMRMPGAPNCETVVARLVHMLVDIVGMGASSQNRSCIRHDACGIQVGVGTKVMFRWEKVVFRDQGREEDAIAVYIVANGTTTCKVEFLPAHLAICAQDYDGLIARVISVYSDRCTNTVKCQKFWRNKGCCVGRILGDRAFLAL